MPASIGAKRPPRPRSGSRARGRVSPFSDANASGFRLYLGGKMVVSSWAWMNKMENLCFIEIWGGFFSPGAWLPPAACAGERCADGPSRPPIYHPAKARWARFV